MGTEDSYRDLDFILRLHTQSQTDFDVEVNTDSSSVHFVDLDIQVSLLFDTNEQGAVEDFNATRLTLPAGDSDRIGYISPPASPRKIKEQRIRSDEDVSTDNFTGDYQVIPGGSDLGISNTLVMKSPSGLRQMVMPDTPVSFTDIKTYNADEAFTYIYADSLISPTLVGMGYYRMSHSMINQPEITIIFEESDDWTQNGYGNIKLTFASKEVHVTKVEVGSNILELTERIQGNYTEIGSQTGTIDVSLSWGEYTEYEKATLLKSAYVTIVVDYIDLRYATNNISGQTSDIYVFSGGGSEVVWSVDISDISGYNYILLQDRSIDGIIMRQMFPSLPESTLLDETTSIETASYESLGRYITSEDNPLSSLGLKSLSPIVDTTNSIDIMSSFGFKFGMLHSQQIGTNHVSWAGFDTTDYINGLSNISHIRSGTIIISSWME